MVSVRKLPSVDSDSSIFFVAGTGVFYGSNHFKGLSLNLMLVLSQLAEACTVLRIIIPNLVSASTDQYI